MRELIVVTACLTSACATVVPGWEQSNIEAISVENGSGIIFEAREHRITCGGNGAIMHLERTSDGAVASIQAMRGMMDNNAVLRAQPIEPGVWQPVALDCRNAAMVGAVATSLVFDISLREIFEPVEVNAGEIVYPGTVHIHRADGQRSARIVDDSEEERRRLEERYPDLAPRFVVRLAAAPEQQ